MGCVAAVVVVNPFSVGGVACLRLCHPRVAGRCGCIQSAIQDSTDIARRGLSCLLGHDTKDKFWSSMSRSVQHLCVE